MGAMEQQQEATHTGEAVSWAQAWETFICQPVVWALMFINFFYCIGFYEFFSDLPTYLSQARGMSMDGSGIMSMLAYVVVMLTTSSSGLCADALLEYGFTSYHIRLIMSTLSCL